MFKSSIAGLVVTLIMIVSGFVHGQLGAPTTQPQQEAFAYRPTLVDPERFARLMDLMLFQSGGETVSSITGATTLPAGTSAGRSGNLASRPVATDGAQGSWRTRFTFTVDPADHSMLVSTLPERWPEIKRLLDRLQDAIAMVSIQVTIVEVPKELREPTIASLAKIAQSHELRPGTPPAIVASPMEIRVLNDSAAKLLESIDPERKLKVVGQTTTSAHINTLSTLTFAASHTEIFPAEKSAEASRAAGIEVIIDMIPHANPHGMFVLDINAKARGRGQASATLPTQATQSRAVVEDGQTLILSGQTLTRTNADSNPLLVFLTVSLQKDEPQ